MPFDFSYFIKNLMKKNIQSPDSIEVRNNVPRQTSKNTYYDRISLSAAKLEAGQENALAVLYPALLSRDENLANSAAEAIYTYLESLNVSKIIKLSLRFREYTSMEWSVDWKYVSISDIRENILNENAFLSILRLGTFHPNGYFREKCMLALEDDEASLPYIALRLNDWVGPVQNTAYRILAKRLPDAKTDTAIEMLPFIDQAKKGQRYQVWQLQKTDDTVTQKILQHPDEISLDRIRDYIPITRRLLYKILIRPDILSKEAAHRLLDREKNGNEKNLIISRILKCYHCSEEELNQYMKGKSPIVRKKALEIEYERLHDAWSGLETHLLDTAKGIRSDVCYILRRHSDFDILSFYKSALHTPLEAIAILGIGENGTKKDADILTEYLYDDTPKLVKFTMKSLSLLGASGLDEIYWQYLNDADVTISKAAYDAIHKSNIHYGAERLYRAYQSCHNCHTRKYLLYLLVQEPSWERLPYLLLLYKPYAALSDHEDKKIQMLIRRALSCRSVYACIFQKQADFIMKVMEMPELEIPGNAKKEILFDLKHIRIEQDRKDSHLPQ